MQTKISIPVAALLLSVTLMLPAGYAAARNNTSAPAESRVGLYAVASSQANGLAAVDISVASGINVQMVTITAEAGAHYRGVLTDAEGRILRTRAVDGEAEWDLYSLPTGTYRIAILNASGDMLMSQTLQKR